MQRSRKALLHRRAAEKVVPGESRFYKVSISLVFVLWGFLFLISLWFIRGDGHRDISISSPGGLSTWNESTLDHDEHSDSIELKNQADMCTDDVKTSSSNEELLSEENVDVASGEGTANPVADQPESEKSGSGLKHETDAPKNGRLPRGVPLGLDEYKSKTFSSKGKSVVGLAGGIKHRVEPGGTDYNYASAAKGAKVLAFNKEAKGASNIISRDKDKYLRNPCSVEGKYVDIELSEETLVDTIKIGNLEHYSSNLRDFELHGSLVYPTDEWVKLGSFTAANIKLAQSFDLEVPKWVRYIKLNLLNHYGSEFYCTISVIEVYGVDAVERMLEDLISVESGTHVSDGVSADQKPVTSPSDSPAGDDFFDINKEMEPKAAVETDVHKETIKNDVPDPIKEVLHQQGSRMPGDTVLQILMQKVRSLDFSLSILERYLEESNSRYGGIFKEFDTDMDSKELEIQKIKENLRNLVESQEIIAKDVNNLMLWQSLVSMQLDKLVRDNAILRSEVERAREKQGDIDNKGIIIFVVCILFSFLALSRLFIDILVSVYTATSVHTIDKSRKFCSISSSWVVLLVSCIIVLFILSI